ncbi:MAG: HAMP domain-containing histidine kinase [Hydrogenophaga sp.]|jgi:signal transduction histidine kinase|nr:HAMP domain-containing histidine kinase [Hydrogenophaga sp.]
MPLDRLWLNSARRRLGRWLVDEVVHTPAEFILHPSRTRLQWLGMFTLVGHLFFAWFWGHYLPQPYENPWVRVGIACSGLLLLLPAITRDLNARSTVWVFSLVAWVQLPLFFSWMYWMNHGNAVWLGSMACMIVIYYHLTDWRLASIGLLLGLGISHLIAEPDPQASQRVATAADHLAVLGFAWSAALLLGASSANLRRTRLLNTLSTIGVLAHEMRTPLATLNLLADVLRNLGQQDVPEPKRRRLEELAGRLQGLVKSMHRQIDTQIANAQLMRLPRDATPIQAAELVHGAVSSYPYRSSRERDCVQVHIQQDFCFKGSRQLFTQTINNLLKNALHALAAASSVPTPGALRIDIGVHHGRGRIAVTDEGVGIAHEHQPRVFEPFFSTQSGAGSGLGLTFCKNVIDAAGGNISLLSEPNHGTVFIIDLPLYSSP